MDDIYMLADAVILSRIGNKLRAVRLKQNITQQSLSETANVSLSSIKKMEKGEIRSFDSLIRVLRILGKLEILQPLVDEEQLSPTEYYNFVHSSQSTLRKRAVGRIHQTKKEESAW
jgi:transcriptional regulator with XRE-family HTH domain